LLLKNIKRPIRLLSYTGLLFLSLLFSSLSFSQELFISTSNPGIDELLDELANNRIIALNSAAKPYSRIFIAERLVEALKKDSLLSKRQVADILLYLPGFSNEVSRLNITLPPNRQIQGMDPGTFSPDPLSINARTRWLAFSLRPVVDYTQYYNQNGAFYSATTGTGIMAYLGKHIALSAGISRTFQNCILANPEYFTISQGGNYQRYSDGGGDFTEWTGQLTYSWKWGSIGLYHDHFTWGNGYHGSNIFSGKPPALPFLKLHVKPAKWLEFNYVHARLYHSELDFSDVNLSDQYVFASSTSKYIAANLLTVTPWRGLDITAGNSIVYDGPFQLAYLIPVLFYKSVDHTLMNTINNENSQMFFDISSRQIKHLHLFLSLFVDEFKMSRIRTKEENNFLGWKAGLKVSDFPARNLFFTFEGTRTLPMTYQHYVPTITYASDGYNLGNYLRDNSQELFLALSYKPFRGLMVSLSCNVAQHGDEFQYGLVEDPVKLPVLKNISWQDQSLELSASYSILSNLAVFINFLYRETRGDIRFTAPVFLGKTSTVSAGLQAGF
jgi:hypothetical protein